MVCILQTGFLIIASLLTLGTVLMVTDIQNEAKTNLIRTFLEDIGSNMGHSHIPEILLREMLLSWFQSTFPCLIFSKTERN